MIDLQKNKGAVVAFFAIAGFLLYLSGLKAPWYFDDFPNIVNNPLVTDLGRAFAGIFQQRGVAFLTFAINHALTGMDPLWFRLTNITLHIGAALLVWRILTRIYDETSFIPLFGGLLFLVHPLQTQVVTYIVQRMAGMAAFFFLLAIFLYLRAREAEGGRKIASYSWYGGALLCAALAIWSKQNTIVIPVILLLVDYAIVDKEKFSFLPSLRRTLPFFLIAALAAWMQLSASSNMMHEMSVRAQVYTDFSSTGREAAGSGADDALLASTPWRYLATELYVLWVYVKLFFFPVGQALDYSWRIVDHIFNVKTVMAAIGFVLSFASIHYFRLWNRRLIFGLAWIVLTLALESSIIPLDPIYEHRMYLPIFGAFIVVQELLFSRISPKTGGWIAAGILLAFSGLTVKRNAQWADPVEFWSANALQTPGSARVLMNVAKAYQDRGDETQSQEWARKSQKLKAEESRSLTKLGLTALQQGHTDEARQWFDRALQINAYDPFANSYLGGIYLKSGQESFGLAMLENAVQLAPESPICLQNLAVAYDLVGRRQDAEKIYLRGLAINPENSQMLLALGVLFDETGRSAPGQELLRRALAQNPEDARVIYYYGLAALHAGDGATYRVALDQLQHLDRNYFAKLANQK